MLTDNPRPIPAPTRRGLEARLRSALAEADACAARLGLPPIEYPHAPAAPHPLSPWPDGPAWRTDDGLRDGARL